MKKSELTNYTELIEKNPSKHTSKLHHIVVKGVYTGYDYSKKRSYTYYVCQTKEGSFYPCANTNNLKGCYLDGLMGSYSLSQLKKDYTITK